MSFCSLLNIVMSLPCTFSALSNHLMNGEWSIVNFDDSLLTIDYNYSKVKSKPNPLSSCTNTLNDSGTPGLGILSPLTIAS